MDYHTSEAQNEVLTRVGPGTPMGDLLRHYWWPIGFSRQLQDKPTMVRLLGEDLVLFKDGQGNLGLLADKCPHRRASLCLGMIGKEGIRCRYHGWLMDTKGALLHAPGEANPAELMRRVKQPAYLAQELGGVIFGYLGSQPEPLLPRFHILVADGERNATIQSFNDCNWLQCVENGIDPFHVSFLHSDVWTPMSAEPEQIRFENTELGCIYKAIRPGRKAGEYNFRDHPVVAPGIIVGGDTNVSYGGEGQSKGLPAASMRWSVPIDDTHTMNVRVYYRPKGQSRSKIEMRENAGFGIKIEPYKELKQGRPN